MDFKSLLSQLDQLNEATEKTKTGLKHTAEPGGYGRKDDEDEEGNKVKSDAPKKGRGRPSKATQSSGEDKKYDFSAFGVKSGKDVKLPKYDKKKSTIVKGKSQSHSSNKVDDGTDPGEEPKTNKKGLKEYFDSLDRALNEAEQIQIKPASQVPPKPGQPAQQQGQQVAGQAKKDTQVIQQGDKTLGTVDNPQLAQQIKQSIGKGEMTLMPDGTMEEGFGDIAKKVGGAMKTAGAKVLDTLGHGSDEDLIKQMQKRAGLPQTGKKPEQQVNEKDIGKHNNATTGFDALVKKLTPKYGVEAAKRIAGAQLKKIKEAERPSFDSTMGAGLGAGRSQGVLEGKKPDFLDLDKDGDKKEPMKKAAQDKKKVKEGMDHKLQAARLEGKSHGLRKEGYNCRFDDMEESRMYHEGYKEGLDECYGQGGLGKVMGETDALPATVPGMASAAEPAMEDDMYEMDKSEWMSHKAKSTPGNTFKAFGQTFKDNEVVESPFAFEAWDNQLNSLLESNEQVNEGMTVSITKGQQGAPDSVSINAQDAEADKLLAFVKQAGLGIFGGEESPTSAYGAPTSTGAEGGSDIGGISVVDDHDGMMNLMKKLSGMGGEVGPHDSQDYEEEGSDEEHSHDHSEEETCNECGMAYEACGGNHGDKEMVEDGVDEITGPDDETQEEYMDQAEEEVAEAEEVVNNDDEANEENSDAVRDAALAQAADNNEKQVDEGEYANSDDDAFAADLDFMTNIISGGLNKKKSTGQTTIPVIAGQDRTTANESIVADWMKLAGIK
jgi:hypothetical protein